MSQGTFDQHVFDQSDRPRGVEVFGAYIGAIHDAMASEQLVRVFEFVQALARRLIARIGKKPPGLQ